MGKPNDRVIIPMVRITHTAEQGTWSLTVWRRDEPNSYYKVAVCAFEDRCGFVCVNVCVCLFVCMCVCGCVYEQCVCLVM